MAHSRRICSKKPTKPYILLNIQKKAKGGGRQEALLESIVGFTVGKAFLGFFKPSGPDPTPGVKLRRIWLDVQKGRAVQNIHISKIQHPIRDFFQTDHR